MHLHQELEGYYLGEAPHHTMNEVTSASIAKAMPRTPRRSNSRIPSEAPSHASSAMRVRRHSKETAPKQKPILLILEDFDEIRAFLVRHFDQRGYDVFSASTLRDALVIAWEEAPQVILIDYDLSGEAALHAIERLHIALPQSYIVLIGGPQTREVTERAILAGASKVLSKAYAISEMDYIVGNAARIGSDAALVQQESVSFS